MVSEHEERLCEVIRQFGENGLLDSVIVIGSWATYFYQKIYDGFIPTIRTFDVDFYIPNTRNIRVKKTVNEILKPINFDQRFDTDSEKSKFVSPEGFEIEFLTKLVRGECKVVKISSLGVNAETLGNLEIFDRRYITIDFEGHSLKVASPSSYVIQKILIADKRTVEKRKKDLESIRIVLIELNKHKIQIDDFKSIIDSFGVKRKRKVLAYLELNDLRIK